MLFRSTPELVAFARALEESVIETIESGSPQTNFMQLGDTIRIEVKDAQGQSVFGAIDQRVVAAPGLKDNRT